ncbi:MAG: TatD family hydrolase, partial [Akkermansiaceae bacterium]|nr:TatD family hydrolase [Akkermansiaceae bacterium]
MLTDTHCHLASRKFPADELPAIVSRAAEAGIRRLVTLATNLDDIPANLAVAEQFDTVFACVGIHPCDVATTPDDYLGALREFARHPRTAAIGETGLDYFHPAPDGWDEDAYHRRQRDFLAAHFELAAETGLNVVIHTRDRRGDASFADALAIYEPFAGRVRAVFHCFPGPFPQARRVLDLGGLVSFTGIATFKNAAEVLDAATRCPAGSFMVETDAPYL